MCFVFFACVCLCWCANVCMCVRVCLFTGLCVCVYVCANVHVRMCAVILDGGSISVEELTDAVSKIIDDNFHLLHKQ